MAKNIFKNRYVYIIAAIFAVMLSIFIAFNKEEQKKADIDRGESVIKETGEANLSWNANKEQDLAGYRIYYGTTTRKNGCPPGGYPERAEVGNKTSYKIENLRKDSTYYFSITSYKQNGKESCFSGEVNKTIK